MARAAGTCYVAPGSLMRTSPRRIAPIVAILACVALSQALFSQAPCQVTFPTASLSVPYVSGEPTLDVDPSSATWKNAGAARILKDCSRTVDYPDLDTTVRGVLDRSVFVLVVRVSVPIVESLSAGRGRFRSRETLGP